MKLKKILTIVIVAIAVLALCGLSWIITCGIIKAITWCFGWRFSWRVATGIWIILCLLKKLFSKFQYAD